MTYIVSEYKELSHLTLHSFNMAGNVLLPMVVPPECFPLPKGPPPPLPFSCQQAAPKDQQSILLGFTAPFTCHHHLYVFWHFPHQKNHSRLRLSRLTVCHADSRCTLRHVYLCIPTFSRFALYQASFFLIHATLPSLQLISFSV